MCFIKKLLKFVVLKANKIFEAKYMNIKRSFIICSCIIYNIVFEVTNCFKILNIAV